MYTEITVLYSEMHVMGIISGRKHAKSHSHNMTANNYI